MNKLLIVGITILCGLMSSRLMKVVKQPHVVGYILVGGFLGLSGFKIYSIQNLYQFDIISNLALGIIGFIIGGELRWARLKRVGFSIIMITFFEAFLSFLFVFTALYLFTGDLSLSLIIGALASATSPGGTTNVIQEYRARGPVTNTLFGVVGADDAFAIIIYALAYNIGKTFLVKNMALNTFSVLLTASSEIFISILLGCILGLLFVLIIRKISLEDEKQLYTLAAVLFCVGLAVKLHCSIILTSMAMGLVISNLRPHPSRSFFLALYRLTPAIYIMFFVLVGTRLQINMLMKIGVIGIIYIIFRTLGKFAGPWIGGTLAKSPSTVRKYLGLCLLPQAGVAIGLAISAQNDLSKISDQGAALGILIINLITATTIIFQIAGPVLAKYALEKAGEIKHRDK
ncbi:MAG: cation:proton antiporter [bacterium]|nr:cation:proton antiporter [bacterium]